MPTAPPTRCTKPGCPRFATRKGRCDEHPGSGWIDRPRLKDRDNSTRQRLDISSTEWQKLWGRTMRDHNWTCHVCGKPGADQVDHIIAVALGGARKDPGNLAPIHEEPCHREKTARELAELARRAKRAKRSQQSQQT